MSEAGAGTTRCNKQRTSQRNSKLWPSKPAAVLKESGRLEVRTVVGCWRKRVDLPSAQPLPIDLQFLMRCSLVRHASACAVSVGFREPLVPITEAPSMPRFGTSCENPC